MSNLYDKSALSARIREAIGDQSYMSVANVSGINNSMISRYAKGDAVPPTDKLVALADGLGVSIEWLASGRRNATYPVGVKAQGVVSEAEPGSSHPNRVRIPILSGTFGAGHAGEPPGEYIESFSEVWREWLEVEVGIKKEFAFFFRVYGDSMQDAFFDGDWVVGERCDYFDRPATYCLIYDGWSYVKYVERSTDGQFVLKSHNKLYSDMVVDESAPLRVVGRAKRKITRVL